MIDLSKPTKARIREIVKKIEARINKLHSSPQDLEMAEYLGLNEYDVIEKILIEELT